MFADQMLFTGDTPDPVILLFTAEVVKNLDHEFLFLGCAIAADFLDGVKGGDVRARIWLRWLARLLLLLLERNGSLESIQELILHYAIPLTDDRLRNSSENSQEQILVRLIER